MIVTCKALRNIVIASSLRASQVSPFHVPQLAIFIILHHVVVEVWSLSYMVWGEELLLGSHFTFSQLASSTTLSLRLSQPGWIPTSWRYFETVFRELFCIFFIDLLLLKLESISTLSTDYITLFLMLPLRLMSWWCSSCCWSWKANCPWPRCWIEIISGIICFPARAYRTFLGHILCRNTTFDQFVQLNSRYRLTKSCLLWIMLCISDIGIYWLTIIVVHHIIWTFWTFIIGFFCILSELCIGISKLWWNLILCLLTIKLKCWFLLQVLTIWVFSIALGIFLHLLHLLCHQISFLFFCCHFSCSLFTFGSCCELVPYIICFLNKVQIMCISIFII